MKIMNMSNREYRKVLGQDLEISELVENKLQDAYQQIQADRRKQKGYGKLYQRKIIVAVLSLFLLVSGSGTVYAMTNEFPFSELFIKLWNGGIGNNVMDEISTDIKVKKEESTFKNLSIQPIQAVTDNFGTYIVLEVKGINGFQLTDDMTFGAMTLENKQKSASVLNGYVLKREGNVLYYALWMIIDDNNITCKEQVFHVGVFDLIYAELYEDGKICREKANSLEDLDSGNYLKACEGQYIADICCEVKSEKIRVTMEHDSVADIHPLGIFINKDSGDTMGMTTLSKEQRDLHVILEDGTEIAAHFSTGLEGEYTICVAEKPIDVENVIGIRKNGKTYYVDEK